MSVVSVTSKGESRESLLQRVRRTTPGDLYMVITPYTNFSQGNPSHMTGDGMSYWQNRYKTFVESFFSIITYGPSDDRPLSRGNKVKFNPHSVQLPEWKDRFSEYSASEKAFMGTELVNIFRKSFRDALETQGL